jgi:S1-C subfamily serine protease
MDSKIAKEINIDRANGVYVDSVSATGAAKEAGVKAKDVIISIDGIETMTSGKLMEIIMRKHPGDKVKIVLIRNGNEKKELIATLKKQDTGNINIKPESKELLKDLGVELVPINKEDQKKYKVENGLKLTKLYNGKLKKNTNIKEGFVITAVNKRKVSSVGSFIEAVKKQRGGIMLEGKYAGDPTYYYYAFGM